MPVLELNHIRKRFGDLEVLQDISLSVEKGEVVAIIGPSGSGKSTLAKHMNAILLPSGGKVYVDGIDTVDEDRLLDIRRTVGTVSYTHLTLPTILRV